MVGGFKLVILIWKWILIGFWLCAVWRHVLGPNDAVDEIDIALGKCNFVHIYNLPSHIVGLCVYLQSVTLERL